MNWWNKNKKILIPVFVGLIFLSVVVAAAILAGPMIGCTMMGCMGGLDITLTGSPASDYQIKVIYPSGETRSLTCGLGAADNPAAFETSCSPDGAFFRLDNDTIPPKSVTVTVVVNGQTFSQEFQPDYRKFQPNGRGCPPTCYSASIEMKITP